MRISLSPLRNLLRNIWRRWLAAGGPGPFRPELRLEPLMMLDPHAGWLAHRPEDH
jgi:hypothetical protein